MKNKNPTSHAPRFFCAFVCGASLLVSSSIGQAMTVSEIVLPQQDILIPLGTQADDDTGVRVFNRESQLSNKISIELLPSNPFLNLQRPDGFVLLDNTLRVRSSETAGKRRIRIRMDYGRFGGRAGLRKAGIRANTIRILRLDRVGQRWLPAVQRINEKRINGERISIRYRRARQPEFILGYHGFDKNSEFAWAVTDTRGDPQFEGDQFFALGGIAAVPLPAAWLLFLSGSGLLLLAGRKRRNPRAESCS